MKLAVKKDIRVNLLMRLSNTVVRIHACHYRYIRTLGVTHWTLVYNHE